MEFVLSPKYIWKHNQNISQKWIVYMDSESEFERSRQLHKLLQ